MLLSLQRKLYQAFAIRLKNSLRADLLNILTGTTLSQIVGIVSVPILTRFYSPDEFGTLALFVSISTILTIFSCLRYELAIILPETNAEALNLMALSLGLLIVTSLIVWMLIVLFGGLLAYALNAPKIISFFWLLPVANFFSGLLQLVGQWNARNHRFDRISLARVIYALVVSGTQLRLGIGGFGGTNDLIIGFVIGTIASSIVAAYFVVRDDGLFITKSIELSQMILLFKRYRKFPLFSLWSGILNSFSWQLPTFLLAAFFSPVVSAMYDLGNKLLRIPMNLVGGAIAQAFLPRIAAARNDGTLASLVESALERLVLFSFFPLLVLSIVGRDLFGVVFGSEWSEAGIYTQILSLWMFFWFISSPLSNLFLVMEKQEFSLKLDILIFVTRLIALTIGGVMNNPRLAILLFAISGILTYGYLCVVTLKLSGVLWKRLLHLMLRNFLAFLPLGIVLCTLVLADVSAWYSILIGVSGTIIFYVWILYGQGRFLKLKTT